MMLSTNYSSKQGIRQNPDHHPKASLHVAPGHSFLCSGKVAVDVGSRKDVRQQPSEMTISANYLPEHGTSSKPQQAPENVFARNTMVQCPTPESVAVDVVGSKAVRRQPARKAKKVHPTQMVEQMPAKKRKLVLLKSATHESLPLGYDIPSRYIPQRISPSADRLRAGDVAGSYLHDLSYGLSRKRKNSKANKRWKR